MRSKAAYQGKRHDFRENVGRFFESLSCQLLHADECPREQGDGVILGSGLNAGIESKASDNYHPFRFDITQMEGHATNLVHGGFLVSEFFYVLWSYRNNCWKKGKRSRLLTSATLEDLPWLLFRRSSEMMVIDLRFLQPALEGGTRSYPLGRKEEGRLAVQRSKTDILNAMRSHPNGEFVANSFTLTLKTQLDFFTEQTSLDVHMMVQPSHVPELFDRIGSAGQTRDVKLHV